MASTKTKTRRTRARPEVVIDRAYVDRLESLAYGRARPAPPLSDHLLEELAPLGNGRVT